MASNAKAFQKELNKLKKAIAREVTLSVQSVVKEIFVTLRATPPLGTPVKTGWARAGWRINLNLPTSGSVGLKGNISSEDTKSNSSLKKFMNRKFLSKVSHIFIDNRVPYISRLNYDKISTQSPKFFIELAAQRGMALAKRKRKVKI